jgi:ABC-type lipoprotein release transport system permease subunit
MILLESFILAVVSTISGGLIGSFFALFLNYLHLPLKSEALQIFFMSNYLHFTVQFSQFMFVTIVLVLTLVLGAIIPTRAAARLKPVTAMQS